MAEPVKDLPRMTTEEFLLWYDAQPEGARYELLDGIVYPRNHGATMQGERVIHGRLKTRIVHHFSNGIEANKLPCEAFADGMAVRVSPSTTLEPDVLVRCGAEPPPLDAIVLEDVTIVVEVTSPSTKRLDTSQKLVRYFRNPKVIHYLIVVAEGTHSVIHHRRSDAGVIETTLHEGGTITLDPPRPHARRRRALRRSLTTQSSTWSSPRFRPVKPDTFRAASSVPAT